MKSYRRDEEKTQNGIETIHYNLCEQVPRCRGGEKTQQRIETNATKRSTSPSESRRSGEKPTTRLKR